MTQQPFYPQPGYPQQYPAQPMQQPQGYPAQPQQPYAPPAQYQGQMPAGYPQGQLAAPAPPPPQSGSIDDFYNQAVAAGGPGISWKDKPIGTWYAGVVSGKPTVQQDTDFDTKAPLFQRDGVTAKWVMLIPLAQVQSSFATFNGQPEFPDGEVIYYARGKDKEELNRAMAEAGCSGAPREGAQFVVSLAQRKPNRKGNPTNVVQIRYVPPNGQPHGPAEQSAPAQPQQEAVAAPSPVQAAPAVPQAAPQAAPAPAPQPAAPQVQAPPQQFQQPGVQYQAPQVQQPPQMQAPIPPGVPQAASAQAAPAPAPAPQPPAGMTPEAQAILAGLTGQQAQG